MVNPLDVVILEKDQTIEDLGDPEVPYFIVSKERVYLYKPTILGPALIPFNGVLPSLGSIGEYPGGTFEFRLPKISAEVMRLTMSFFRQVYTARKTEAEVLLMWSEELRKWGIHVPPQEVTAGSVFYFQDPENYAEGYQPIGTVHSHCMGSSFHSGIDVRDAEGFNGIHITAGHVMYEPDFASMITINGKQFDYPIDDVADLSELEGGEEAPIEWLSRLQVPARGRIWNFWDWDGDYGKPDTTYNKRKSTVSYGTRYSAELGFSVDSEYWDSKNHRIGDDYFIDAIDDHMKDLITACKLRGYSLSYNLTTAGRGEIPTEVPVERVNGTPIMLPGPMSVMGEE